MFFIGRRFSDCRIESMKITKIGCVQHDCAECKLKAKSAREMKKYFLSLTSTVKAYLVLIDIEMKAPSTNERRKRIAALMNKLEMQNDIARHFGLNLPLGK